MKIVELADLPRDLRTEYAGTVWLDGDLPQGPELIDRLVGLGYRYSEYRSLIGVDQGRVLGRIETIILPYRTAHGSESVLGVTGVISRPDVLRRGVASRLLKEAHARERLTDRRWSFLWTHRSWGAHRMYEQLGYRDVYSPPSAVREIRRSAQPSLPPGYRAKKAEVNQVEELYRASTRRRLGFLPRFPGWCRARIRLGWREKKDFTLLTYGSVPVGYAYTTGRGDAVGATEVVVRHPRHSPAMLDLLERKAAGKWLALGRTTFITDNEEMLASRGYLVSRPGHATLMAKPLRRDSRRPPSADPSVLCQSPAFAFHSGDVF